MLPDTMLVAVLLLLLLLQLLRCAASETASQR
jgi:hypothetical protein